MKVLMPHICSTASPWCPHSCMLGKFSSECCLRPGFPRAAVLWHSPFTKGVLGVWVQSQPSVVAQATAGRSGVCKGQGYRHGCGEGRCLSPERGTADTVAVCLVLSENLVKGFGLLWQIPTVLSMYLAGSLKARWPQKGASAIWQHGRVCAAPHSSKGEVFLPSALWAQDVYSGRAEARGKWADEASLRSVGQLGLVLCVWCTPEVKAEPWAAGSITAQRAMCCLGGWNMQKPELSKQQWRTPGTVCLYRPTQNLERAEGSRVMHS